jgi:hypothetical protein
VSSFHYKATTYLAATNQRRNSFIEEKKALFDRPGFTPNVNVYKVFFRWYAKNTKGLLGQYATLPSMLATVGVFCTVLGLEKTMRIDIEGVCSNALASAQNGNLLTDVSALVR